MKRIRYILMGALGISLLIHACVPGTMEPGKYKAYIEDKKNGYVKEKEVSGYVFGLKYKPAAYSALQEVGMKNRKLYPDIKLEMEGLHHLVFRINTEDGSSVMEQLRQKMPGQPLVEYFSSTFAGRIKCVQGSDTLASVVYHFERSYHMRPDLVFILGFEKKKEVNEDLVFIYEDEILGTGKVIFRYKKRLLQQNIKVKGYDN